MASLIAADHQTTNSRVRWRWNRTEYNGTQALGKCLL